MTAVIDVNFEEFQVEWLADVTEGSPSTVELGRRFAHKLLTQWLDIDSSSEDLIYCDGSGDGGIDIAHLERGDTGEDEGAAAAGDIWYIVQSKFGKSFALLSRIMLVPSANDPKGAHRTPTNPSTLKCEVSWRLA